MQNQNLINQQLKTYSSCNFSIIVENCPTLTLTTDCYCRETFPNCCDECHSNEFSLSVYHLHRSEENLKTWCMLAKQHLLAFAGTSNNILYITEKFESDYGHWLANHWSRSCDFDDLIACFRVRKFMYDWDDTSVSIIDDLDTVTLYPGHLLTIEVHTHPNFYLSAECDCENYCYDRCPHCIESDAVVLRRDLWLNERSIHIWSRRAVDFYYRFKDTARAKIYITPTFANKHHRWLTEYWTVANDVSKAVASLNYKNIILSGDVEQNPGPVYAVPQVLRSVELQMKRSKSPKQKTLRRATKEIRQFIRDPQHLEKQKEKKKTLSRLQNIANKNRYKFQVANLEEILLSPGVVRAAGYVATNMVAPGVGTAMATAVEGGRLLNATEHIVKSAESLASSCNNQFSKILEGCSNVTDLATLTISNINDLVSKLNGVGGLLSKMTDKIIEKCSSVSLVNLIITVILVVAMLAWNWKLGCSVIVMVLVYLNWPPQVTDKIKQIMLHSMPGSRSESESQFLFQVNLSDHITMIGQIVFTLIAFFGVSKIPTGKNYDSLIKRLDAIPKAASGAMKIWEQAGKMFQFVSEEFQVYFLGQHRSDLVVEKQLTDEVNKWVDRVKFYTDAHQRNLLARDTNSVKEVEELFTKMYRWKHTPHLWKAFSNECQRIITSATPLMNDLFKFACRSTVHEGGPRKAPLAIFISGDSGRGKSEMLYPLAYSLLAHRGCDMENARNEIYVRNYETEYWDGYVGQKVAFFDDAFQMRDSPGNPSPEFMEAIRLINTAPAHVHCADLNDKGRFFSSEICIYTTNLKEKFSNYITSINCPEAAMRRLNANAYRIKTAPRFEKEVTINGMTQRRLDVNKIKNCPDCVVLRSIHEIPVIPFCPHVQLFDKYDLLTDEILETDLTFSDLLKQLKEYDDGLVKSESDKLMMYELLMDKPFLFEMNAVEESPISNGYAARSDYGEEAEPEFFDSEEINYDGGPLDFACPTDVVAYQALDDFVKYLTSPRPEGLGILDQARIDAEIAAHESLWRVYCRIYNSGIINIEKKNESLQIAMDRYGIRYNHITDIYCSTQSFRYKFDSMCNSFKDMCKRLCDQLRQLWERSSIVTVLYFVEMSLVLVSTVFVMSLFFKKKDACEYCKCTECVCVRLIDGVLMQGNKPYVQLESNIKPLVNHSPHFKVESDIKPGVNVRPQPHMKVESSSVLSGQPRTTSMKVEMYTDNGCESLERKIINNSLYLLHTSKTPIGNVLFVKGNIMLINKHYVELFRTADDQNKTLYLSNRSSCLCEFTIKDVLDGCVPLEKNGDDIDACLVFLDPRKSKVHPHVDIIKHFIKNEDLSMLTSNYRAQMPTYNSYVEDIIVSRRSLHDVSMSHNSFRIQDRNITIEVNHSWCYGGSTSSGDCGAPIILNEPSAIRKIVGIHMASDGVSGLSQTVTQEMINGALSKIPFRFQNYVHIDLNCEPLDVELDQEGSVPLNKGLIVHGKTDLVSSAGNKTKIMPSPLFDFVPHKTLPTCLRKTGDVDPMYKGLVKYGKQVPRIDPNLIEIAVNDVSNNLNVNVCFKDVNDYKRVLSYVEAVQGVPGDDFIAPINRSTSLGFPYSLCTIGRGKRNAFGTDEWTMDTVQAQKIKDDVSQLIQNCRDGVQTGVYWSDTLKDERRPIQKVLDGKTRVFCAGPVHLTIAFRQYFLGFAAWMMHNRNANEISVGTNVFSQDWDNIVRKLAARGKTERGVNVVAGDFTNFDGSLSSQILWAILDLINDWYDDGEENRQIRETMWMHIVHAIHINHNVIYQATHSQPSGCPITAILNSIYNSVVVRIVFLICANNFRRGGGQDYCSMLWFNKCVSMVSYGDDNLIGINDYIISWFNQETIAEAFKVIGHEYTDEAKTGVIVPVRDITEVAYLKRKFVWNACLNRYVAPLDLDVVLEIPQWTKRGLCKDSITMANIDVTMRELSLHPKEVFDEYSDMLRRECERANIPYRFLTQREYVADVQSEPLMLESNVPYVLKKTSEKLARNFIRIDRVNRVLYVNSYNPIVLKHKLGLLCAYRNMCVSSAEGIPDADFILNV